MTEYIVLKHPELKIWDDEKHRQYTGVLNVIIKENKCKYITNK